MNVEHEVKLLVQEIKRLGTPNADGQVSVKFGVLFNDDRCANIFEGEKLTLSELDLVLKGAGSKKLPTPPQISPHKIFPQYSTVYCCHGRLLQSL